MSEMELECWLKEDIASAIRSEMNSRDVELISALRELGMSQQDIERAVEIDCLERIEVLLR